MRSNPRALRARRRIRAVCPDRSRGLYWGPKHPRPSLTRHGYIWTPDLFDQDVCGLPWTAVDGPLAFGTKRSRVQLPPARPV